MQWYVVCGLWYMYMYSANARTPLQALAGFLKQVLD